MSALATDRTARTMHRLGVGLLLLAAPPVILAGAWRMAGVSAIEDDLLYYLPCRAFLGQSLRQGHWPWWNPYVWLGYPLAADPQAGFWYPFTYLFALLPATLAYPVSICLHFSLAGWGMYRFVRATGRCRWASLFAAVAFQFCGFLVAHRAHLTMHHAAAWLGWILFAWHRFALVGGARYFVFAVALGGLQLLVQHVQVSLITAVITAGYVLGLYARRRPRLAWQLPAGMALSAMLAGIQLVPTWALFARSTRAEPFYDLFVQNSFEPISAVLWIFPMIFGSRTPNFYAQPWWGPSHLCEQAAYASIAVLTLAAASFGLWRRDRQVRFWLIAAGVSLALGLGRHNPLTRLLFEVPVLNGLRVPARWLLGFSLALPILAAAVLDQLRPGRPLRDRASASVRAAALGFLPVLTGFWLVMMVIARVVRTRFAPPTPEAIDRALRVANPAIWIPLILVGLTMFTLVQVARSATRRRKAALMGLLLVDLFSFAGFVDMDRTTYTSVRELRSQPLAAWIHERESASQPGRLWVPRIEADYRRPLEVLWPATNMLLDVPTLHGYGPLVLQQTRALMRFQPWGSTEAAVGLLRNSRLLASLAVRWIAVRSPEERALLRAAGAGEDDGQALAPLGAPNDRPRPIEAGRDLAWPVELDRAGLYAFEFEAIPDVDADRQRWYVTLETPQFRPLATVHTFEPADLAVGRRRWRCYFLCEQPAGQARLRVACFRGRPVAIAKPHFGRVADLDAANEAMRFACELPNGVRVYEIPGAMPPVRFARGLLRVESLARAVELATFRAVAVGLPQVAIVEGPGPATASNLPDGTISLVDRRTDRLELDVQVPADGFLVVAESYDPGWQATVDGAPVPIFRTNAVVQGIEVPAGRHRIVLRYRPEGLTAGAICSGTAATALLAILLAGPLRRARGRRARSDPPHRQARTASP